MHRKKGHLRRRKRRRREAKANVGTLMFWAHDLKCIKRKDT
jgi:hypothetical protein